MAKHEPVVDTRSSQAADSPTQPEASPEPAGVSSEQPSARLAEEVSAELRVAQEEAQETFARYQRLAADFENYKRRTRQEMAERTQYANEELLRKLLPVLDSFKRLIDHAPSGTDPAWFEGVKLVARQFEATLEAQGLSPIQALGQKFDPAQHEAIAREETDAHEEGTVIEEMQPGYRLHDRVLRPTLVKVAQPPALPR
jgi:molecular chaperone GrpE